jgi:antitoxin HicB
MGKRKDLKYYLSLPYTIQITREDESTWFARVVELPGCMTEGDSPEEAADMIQDALAAWLEVALEDGRSIPEPQTTEAYSGRFVVRVPRTLHQQLVEAAEQEGVSLNQFINVALAGRVTRPTAVKTKPTGVLDRTRAAKTARAAVR